MEYVADTHAFLWHLYRPDRLAPAARAAFVSTDRGEARMHIPAVAVAEALMVAEEGRLPGLTTEKLLPWLRAAKDSENYVLTSLSPEIVLASSAHVTIPDIFDRLIVTEALLSGHPLITRDPVIVEAELVSTIWD